MRMSRWMSVGLLVGAAAVPAASCSSESGQSSFTGSPNGGNGQGGDGQGGGSDASDLDQSLNEGSFLDVGQVTDGSQFDPDAYWVDDPPPQQCLDSGMTYPVPGGTPECPDDKNREGCPCTTVGETAACWPGFRKNRNRGICHDGTTTCIAKGENAKYWGPCEGYQLPTGTTGKEACMCFSAGQWKLDNLSPCFVDSGGGDGSAGAVSTIINGSNIECPPIGTPIVQPTAPWSPDTLKVDCAGHFKLCYALKAGDSKNPLATDCLLAKVCTEADYPTANVVQDFPDLPSWLATTPDQITCAKQFASTGGYGEMSVVGLSVECDEVDDGSGGELVFNRVQYCPLLCNDTPTDPACVNCQAGGSGSF